MKYTILICSVVFFTACGSDTDKSESATDNIDTSDMTPAQRDSFQKVKEEEEMSEHVIEGAFDALNR